MLTLYIKYGCPYCIRVTDANAIIKAPLNIVNISGNAALREELMIKAGKTQTPYLVDTDRGVAMHESLDIVEYLKEHYGSGAEVSVSEVGNVCPID